MNDPIIEEEGCARKKIEAEQNDDWHRLIRYLAEKQKAKSLKAVSHPPERLPDRDVA
jgi:hypothetical protein